MMLRVGISRQQYQRLESMGNPRLDTLELIAKGLKSELMLIPQEKLAAVKAVMSSDDAYDGNERRGKAPIADDPWKDILGNEE
jgi:transcriptional regulator with XRE-family HTH domain